METLIDHTVGELVARDYRTSVVFDRYGIDFCCQGGRTLREACSNHSLDPDSVERELIELLEEDKGGEHIDFNSWPADLLVDYIEKKHHRYVRERIPVLQGWLYKVSTVHGRRHPELIEIRDLFDQSAEALMSHMQKEETILFPYIRTLINGDRNDDSHLDTGFGQINDPIQMLREEHSAEGERFNQIASLSNAYQAPSDACTTYRVTYHSLAEFEEDLHHHIHLENNILFPKAVGLKNQLVSDIQSS